MKENKSFFLVQQGSKIDYAYKEFYLDSEESLSEIIIDEDICPGSKAIIISTGVVFVLSNKKEWVKL